MYVDGYNLYYGRLRNSAFKWLDLVALFDSIVARRDQNEKLYDFTSSPPQPLQALPRMAQLRLMLNLPITGRSWLNIRSGSKSSLASTHMIEACYLRLLMGRLTTEPFDRDAEPVLQAIRQDFPNIMIGVVIPIPPPTPGAATHRRISGSLSNQADWVMPYLTDEQLREAQLPDQIPTRKKPLRKASHW